MQIAEKVWAQRSYRVWDASPVFEAPLHIHTEVDAALGQGKRQQLIAHVTIGLLQPSPHLPCEHRDGEPRNCREDEGPGGRPHDHQPDHEAESRQSETSERRSGGIERRGFLATPRSRQTRFLLAFPDMLFDQCRACGKDRGKGKKEAASDWPEAAAMRPATTVIAPPSTNLTRYSYQRV